jgi:hypothetical protein
MILRHGQGIGLNVVRERNELRWVMGLEWCEMVLKMALLNVQKENVEHELALLEGHCDEGNWSEANQ